MKSSDLWKRNYLAAVSRLDGPSVRRILPERQVRARPVVVGEIGTKNLSEMALVENNDVSRQSRLIEPIALSTNGFCHGLRGAVTTSSMPIAFNRSRNS